jgi:hypothetical protein
MAVYMAEVAAAAISLLAVAAVAEQLELCGVEIDRILTELRMFFLLLALKFLD